MKMPHAIVIAAALIAAALLAQVGRTQSTTTPFSTAWVVGTCGTAPTLNPATGMAYLSSNQAPLTINTSGQLCVNQ
jgi:hypothetical protein